MTPEQADILIEQLNVLTVLVSNAVFLLMTIALGAGFIIGIMTWNVIVNSRKSKFF